MYWDASRACHRAKTPVLLRSNQLARTAVDLYMQLDRRQVGFTHTAFQLVFAQDLAR